MDQSGLWQTELSCLERDGDMTFDMREVVLTYRSNKSRLMGCLHDELFPDWAYFGSESFKQPASTKYNNNNKNKNNNTTNSDIIVGLY